MENNDIYSYATLNQTQGHENTSDKYSFIPTTKVLRELEDAGWFPSKIVEMRANKPDRKGFQKHAVRLRHADYSIEKVGFPEIVLTNSHLGNSAFKLQLGLFRVVCANGMIAGDIYKTASVRHSGYTAEKVHEAIANLVSEAPRLITDVSVMEGIQLNRAEQEHFANAIIETVWDGEKYAVEPDSLLYGRRSADGYGVPEERSLFQTFNVLQENVIKGRIMQYDKLANKRRRSRAITAIDKSEKVNQIIWKLADTIKNARLEIQ